MDRNENVVAHYEYAAFGAVLKETGVCTLENPWIFSSEYDDGILGLVYYNYRHYDSIVGRWQTRDSVSDILLYCFVENNITTYDILGEKSTKPSWRNNKQLKDTKTINEPEPKRVAVVRAKGLTSTSYLKADVLGQVVPPPPHSFEVKPVCATVTKWRVILSFKLTLQIEYVPKGVSVTLPDGSKKTRTRAGVDRTIKHEKEHAAHFKSTFNEIWNLADADRGGYGVDMSRQEAEMISRKIRTKLSKGGAYDRIWSKRVTDEDSHSGDAWDNWFKDNGTAIP